MWFTEVSNTAREGNMVLNGTSYRYLQKGD